MLTVLFIVLTVNMKNDRRFILILSLENNQCQLFFIILIKYYDWLYFNIIRFLS